MGVTPAFALPLSAEGSCAAVRKAQPAATKGRAATMKRVSRGPACLETAETTKVITPESPNPRPSVSPPARPVLLGRNSWACTTVTELEARMAHPARAITGQELNPGSKPKQKIRGAAAKSDHTTTGLLPILSDSLPVYRPVIAPASRKIELP